MESNINMCILIAITIAIIILIRQFISDYYWRKKPNHNFPIKYRGKVFWFSRSVAVTLFTFCKNKNGQLCILANRRGTGTPDFQGYWNAPCGYIDFDENGEKACQRETFEETGVFINTDNIIFDSVNTEPIDNKRQNVSLRYISKIEDKVTEDIKFDTSHSEKNEVSDVKWIPINELDNYEWAFNHKMIINEIIKKINK